MLAPVDAFQVSVGLVETPVAPDVGETSVGGLGRPGADPEVVKLEMADHAPEVLLWTPLTLQ